MGMHHPEKTPVQVDSLCLTTHPGEFIIWKKTMLFTNTTHIAPQTLPPFFRTFLILLTPNIILANIFLHKKMNGLIHSFQDKRVHVQYRYMVQIQM